MKKNLLSILIMSVLVVGVLGVVSAQSFISPTDSYGYLSGEVPIYWENTAGYAGLELQYSIGTCASHGNWAWLADSGYTSEESYSWNTAGVSDGAVCLRLESNGNEYNPIELIVDNTDPQVDLHETTVPYPGADEKFNEVRVLIDYGDDNLDSCKINWGDGSALEDCETTGTNNEHQYEDNGEYEVIVTVTDLAENYATDSIEVEVANLDPTMDSEIDGPEDVAVGQIASFTADADDVEADLDAGLTCTWRFDSSNRLITNADEEGVCNVEYTWTHASTHTVDLTISDKDGGSVNAVQYEVDVQNPEYMTPMQQVVINNPFEFDLNSQWEGSDATNFKTSFANAVTCEFVSGPSMTINGDGTECDVDWTPANDEKGEHKVIIRVEDSSTQEYKYYSFDVTVYSWGIHLNKGWNLISIPLIPTSTDIDDVLGGIIENVAYEDSSTATILMYDATYNNNEGRWYKARPTSTHSSFTWSSSSYRIEEVTPGYAYWIKMENEDWIYGIEENFNPSQGQLLVPSVELATESWNLVGKYGTSTPLGIFRSFESLEGYYFFNGVYGFDGVNGWDSTTSLELGKGYWVRTKIVPDKETITYEPISYYFS